MYSFLVDIFAVVNFSEILIVYIYMYVIADERFQFPGKASQVMFCLVLIKYYFKNV